MQCYTELLPPTAVTHAVTLPLTGPGSNDLILGKTSLIEVHRIIKHAGVHAQDDGLANGEATLHTRLVCVGSYPLSGTITSMARLSITTKSGGDALLVSFKDAKMSLLEWDAENHRIATILIHYYESINSLPTANIRNLASKVTVDQHSRCAALTFGPRQIAILPFHQGELDGDDDVADGAADMQNTHTDTPYISSTVLALTTLDPSLTHPIDLAFLYEYRDPTFGIISSTNSTSIALRDLRKDIVTYNIVTFSVSRKDRSATTLLAVSGLPATLDRVVPLPLPIGGALLLGSDALVHVDQSGKTNGLAVNEYARQDTAFSLVDRSELDLRLENCQIGTLDAKSGTLLLALASGKLVVLSFRIDGRSVSGLSLHPVAKDKGGHLAPSSPTAINQLSHASIFIGSDQGDSVILDWTQMQSRKRRRDDASDSEDDVNDDFYGDTLTQSSDATVNPDQCLFTRPCSLQGLGPITSTCFGPRPLDSASAPRLSILATIGRDRGSRLVSLGRQLTPNLVDAIEAPDAKCVWSIRTNDKPHDDYLVRYDTGGAKLFRIDNSDRLDGPEEPQEVVDTDFEREDETLNMGTLTQGRRIVQVRTSEIRCYDSDVGLSQIYEVVDPQTEQELQVKHSTFCDPYLAIIASDSSCRVLQADAEGELQDVEASEDFSAARWMSASIYRTESGDALLCLLDTSGGLHIYGLPDLTKPAYLAPTLSALPPVLSLDDRQRRLAARETLHELLVTDLGDEVHQSPYLILRTSTDELIIYEAFHHPQHMSKNTSFTTGLRFRKVPGLHLPVHTGEKLVTTSKLQPMTVGRYRTVAIAGSTPVFIIRESTSLPRIVHMSGTIKSLTSLNTVRCKAGFSYIDDKGMLKQATLPRNTTYTHAGWTVTGLDMDIDEVHRVAYHKTSNLYVAVTSTDVDYVPSEEEQKQPGYNDDVRLRPQTKQYAVHLISPTTSSVIDTFPLSENDMLTSLVCAPLEISEVSHEQKELVALGTIVQRGESNASRGAVYVLDIIDVVPDPARPETSKKLSLLTREVTKAGVTAMMAIEGLLGTAQVLKLLFRGLKEDTSQCLPIAFLDAPCYMHTLKTLANTNLWLAADAWKGVWFGGFSEDPYKITLFGKSQPDMELVAAEFLPDGKHLYIAAIDADTVLHILQFDPDNPKTMFEKRLVHRSSICTGHLPTCMALVPTTIAIRDDSLIPTDDGIVESPTDAQLNQVIVFNQSGSISLLTPLDEAAYRRLSALQTQMTYMLEHVGGLNPRAYRNASSDSEVGARVCVDGDIVTRIGEFGAGKRSELLGRAGLDVQTLRADLGIVSGAGLRYF